MLESFDNVMLERVVFPLSRWFTEFTGRSRFMLAKALLNVGMLLTGLFLIIAAQIEFLPNAYILTGALLALLVMPMMVIIFRELDACDASEEQGKLSVPPPDATKLLLRVTMTGTGIMNVLMVLAVAFVVNMNMLLYLFLNAGGIAVSIALYLYTSPSPPPRKESRFKPSRLPQAI